MKKNVSSASHHDVVLLAKASGSALGSNIIGQQELSGARILSHTSLGSLLADVDADQKDYIDFLRLYTLVHHVNAHHTFPPDSPISDPSCASQEIMDKLKQSLVSEEMLLRMDTPVLFAPVLGIKASVLAALKDKIENSRRSKIRVVCQADSHRFDFPAAVR